MMMIELEINDNAFEATLTSYEDAEAFFEGAEVLIGRTDEPLIRNWRMNVYDGRDRHVINRSYGCIDPVNAAASFYASINEETGEW